MDWKLAEIDLITAHLLALIDSADEPPIVALFGCADEKNRTLLSVNIALALSSEGLDIALVDANATGSLLRFAVDHLATARGFQANLLFKRATRSFLPFPHSPAAKSTAGPRTGFCVASRAANRAPSTPLSAMVYSGNSAAIERVDWVVPVINAGANELNAIKLLPAPLAEKIALILCSHANPWTKQSTMLESPLDYRSQYLAMHSVGAASASAIYLARFSRLASPPAGHRPARRPPKLDLAIYGVRAFPVASPVAGRAPHYETFRRRLVLEAHRERDSLA